MKMRRIPGDLPYMLSLIAVDGEHEFEFYETEGEADQAAQTMIESGIENGDSIFISKVISQGTQAREPRGG